MAEPDTGMSCGGAFVLWLVGMAAMLGALYGLVRFAKWAWGD